MTLTSAGQKLLDSFDHIAIINLVHRTDRRREMTQQLARLGLDFDHPAVSCFDACRFEDSAGFQTAGARGCFHSHLGVWRDALARKDRSVLLLEDDLDFCVDVETNLPAVLEALSSQDWSVFYGAMLKWEAASPPTSPIALARPEESVMGGHFVAMRGEAIARLVDYLEAILMRPPGSPEGGAMHVDGAYSWFRAAHPDFQTWI
ncbi:MAG: glycosyltransferase family 25 protein, partial [Gammaproteobacteria bacterium]|nr:glycosyltransferase family 25 protein [Gammaproteobacteria bacterium]